MAIDATSSKMNRRHFLRNAAVAVGAAALSLGTSESSQAGDRLDSNTKRDRAERERLQGARTQETSQGIVCTALGLGFSLSPMLYLHSYFPKRLN